MEKARLKIIPYYTGIKNLGFFYGVYKTLRLYPNTDVGPAPEAFCSSNEEGAMSYDLEGCGRK